MPSNRLRPSKIMVLTVGFGLLVGSFGWYFGKNYFDTPKAADELEAAVSKAQSVGLPMEAKDLFSKPEPSLADNALPLLEAWDKNPDQGRYSKSLGVLMKRPFSALCDQEIRNLEPVLASFREIARKPRLRLNLDWDIPMERTYAPLAAIRIGSKYLGVAAEYRAFKGDLTGAIKELDSAYQLTELAIDEPVQLFGMILYTSNRSVLNQTVQRILVAHAPDTESRAQLEALMRRHPYDNVFREAMRYEAYSGLAVARNADQYGVDQIINLYQQRDANLVRVKRLNPKRVQRSGFEGSVMQRAFIARHLQLWGLMRFKTYDPMSIVFQNAKNLDDRIILQKSQIGLSYSLNKILSPFYHDFAIKAAEQEAEDDSLHGLLAVLKYRDKFRRVPKFLTDLSVEYWDPFSDKPLLFRVDGRVLQVYSVGKDRRDDAGMRKSEMGTMEENVGDVGARYSLPLLK